ncbi:uncharacterized protein LOC126744811 isoform X2 [Anthonomus grandis grandis]|nr:uncharacterized protein LOC126744811 isoform X2 [Anthonomus grandis grandis]
MTDVLTEVMELRRELILIKKEPTARNSLFNAIPVSFPISSDEDMAILEEYLTESIDFHNAVLELAKIGGSRPYDFISRVATLLISNEQALKYSWLGRKGKRIFSDTRVANLLIEALSATSLANTRKEAETAIQLWLRRAFDRKNNKFNKK